MREQVLLGLDRWGRSAVAAALDGHPRLRDLVGAAALVPVEAQTSTLSSLEQVTLLVPQAEAFRRSLSVELQRTSSTQGDWSRLLPEDWMRSAADSLPERLDDLYRHRHAALSSESRLRRQLAALSSGAARVLLVAAPDEALAAGVLIDVARWLREEADKSEGPMPVVDLLVALRPIGERATAAPEAAARLHRALAQLDELASRPDEDPFRHRFVLAPLRSDGAPLLAAASEAIAWLARGNLPPQELSARIEGSSFRGRPIAWRAITAATVLLDPAELAGNELLRLTNETKERLIGPSEGRGRFKVREQVQRLATESERGLAAATSEERKRIEGIARTRLTDPRVSPRRLEQLAEEVETALRAALSSAHRFFFGGTINRMAASIDAGWLDRQFEWCWSVVLSGHATLDEVVGWWNVLTLELPETALEREAREATREFELATARKLDGAPQAVAQAAKLAELQARARLALARLDWEMRRELREGIGQRTQVLMSARASAEALPKAVTPTRPPATGPHRAALPLAADELHRSLAAEGLGADAWLRELASGQSGLPARVLGRPLPDLLDSLRAHVEKRLNAFLQAHPVCELRGIGPWMATLVEGLPPTSTTDARSLPSCLRRPPESWLLAGVEHAVALGGAFPGSPTLRAAGEAERLGWLSLGPLQPLAAFSGLEETGEQLRRALRERRLHAGGRTGPTRDPLPGDLPARLRRELAGDDAARGWAAPLAAAEAARPEGIAAAVAPLVSVPRRGPAGMQLAVLAEWAGWVELEALAGLERSAQELQRALEPDGSDTELIAVVKALAAVVAPVQKALELRVATERVLHLTAAGEGLMKARSRADTELAGFERRLMMSIIEGWRQVIAANLTALRGRSELSIELRTRRLISSAAARLVLEVRNSGEHPATAAAVRLLASPAFRILGEDRVDLGPMPGGDSRRVEFNLKTSGAGALALKVELAWDDLEAKGKSLRRDFEAELVDEPPPFRRIERNPYIAGPPVRSEEMFFGREDIFRYVAENLAGRFQDNILILHGQRRTGKSSILYQLERRELLPQHVPVLVDLQGLGGFDTSGLLHQLARQAGRRLAKLQGHEALEQPSREAFKESCYEAFQDYLDKVEDSLEADDRRLLFMIDEFDVLADRVDRGAVEPEVFPFLRNLMQHRERVAFLLAGTHELLEMRRDYWSILFSLAAYRQVSYLDEAEARALIEKPLAGEVQFDDLVVDALLHLTAGHAYYLQLTCQNLVNHLNRHSRHAWVTPEDLQAVLPEVLEAGSGHFEHEWRSLKTTLSRALLREIAALDDTGLRFHGAAELSARIARLGEADLVADEDSVARALEALTLGELLEERAGGQAWRIRVDLMRRWIRRRKPSLRREAEAAS